MAPLLVILFFLALFVAAPLKVALLFCGALLLATLAVQATAATVSGMAVSLTASFKAIVLAVFFSAVALFTIVSFMLGAPRPLINAASGWLLAVLQFGAFVLAFRMSLNLTTLHAALVGVVSTAVTLSALWYLATMGQLAG